MVFLNLLRSIVIGVLFLVVLFLLGYVVVMFAEALCIVAGLKCPVLEVAKQNLNQKTIQILKLIGLKK